MSNPYVGEVRLVGFNFAPVGWAFCDGSLMSIAQNTALFSILGTTYGGDGVQTFALPDLRGRTPLHRSAVTPLGLMGGEEQHTLSYAEMPSHSHLMGSYNQASSNTPAGSVLAAKPRRGANVYTAPAANQTIDDEAATGGNLPHENRQPYLVLNYIISLFGIYPSRA